MVSTPDDFPWSSYQYYIRRKLKDTGKHFGVGESAVSQTIRRFEATLLRDKKLRKQIEKISQDISLSNMQTKYDN